MNEFVYVSIEEAIRQNAYRHEYRGLDYTELGEDVKAKGSFVKAVKFHNKADKYRVEFYNSSLDKAINVLAKNVAETIINGT